MKRDCCKKEESNKKNPTWKIGIYDFFNNAVQKKSKPWGRPEENDMMSIVLSDGRSGHTVFLEVKFPSLAANVKQDRVTNVHL